MKRYLLFLRPYKRNLFWVPLLVCIDVGCEIVQPVLMSEIVDVGISEKKLSYIIRIGLLMIGLSVIAIGANLGNVYLSTQVGTGFASELRKGLFKKIQQLSFSNLDKFRSASLITRITNDVSILQQITIMSLRLLIRAPLMLFFAVMMAVRINLDMALIITVMVPILSWSIYSILKKGIPFFEKTQKKLDWLNTVVQENLVNIRLVKSFVRENFESLKFKDANNELRDVAIKASGIIVMIIPVMQLVMGLSIVAIVWFGGNKIVQGELQVGALMSFITYITQILMSLMMLSMTIMSFSRARVSSARIIEVLDTQVDILSSPHAIAQNFTITKGKIEFTNVCFKYSETGNKYVLKDINFSVEPGETVGIIGATGSSKSTLVQLIPRLYDASKGYVFIDGRDIKDYTLQNLREGISVVLQESELFSGTIKENLRWGNKNATDEEIIQAAKDAQAHDFIMSFPKQYDTILEQGAVNISGGQKQRLSIARALLRNPHILILDDSTSAVDMVTEKKIKNALKRNFQERTLIIISQRISSIQQSEKIIVMNDGQIADIGTHSSLMANSLIYQEIYKSQQLNTEVV